MEPHAPHRLASRAALHSARHHHTLPVPASHIPRTQACEHFERIAPLVEHPPMRSTTSHSVIACNLTDIACGCASWWRAFYRLLLSAHRNPTVRPHEHSPCTIAQHHSISGAISPGPAPARPCEVTFLETPCCLVSFVSTRSSSCPAQSRIPLAPARRRARSGRTRRSLARSGDRPAATATILSSSRTAPVMMTWLCSCGSGA